MSRKIVFNDRSLYEWMEQTAQELREVVEAPVAEAAGAGGEKSSLGAQGMVKNGDAKARVKAKKRPRAKVTPE
ncbi:MAG: hypothetical protein M3347_00175 [Armatimonadota bacterium]|nr:hypothetical protein [Armatimonadota bacterium]